MKVSKLDLFISTLSDIEITIVYNNQIWLENNRLNCIRVFRLRFFLWGIVNIEILRRNLTFSRFRAIWIEIFMSLSNSLFTRGKRLHNTLNVNFINVQINIFNQNRKEQTVFNIAVKFIVQPSETSVSSEVYIIVLCNHFTVINFETLT